MIAKDVVKEVEEAKKFTKKVKEAETVIKDIKETVEELATEEVQLNAKKEVKQVKLKCL